MQLAHPFGVMFKSAILMATLAVIAVGGTVATVGALDNTHATVELRVWQRVGDPLRMDLSVRPAGGRWGRTERLPMAETSASKTFRYTDRSVAVPVAGGTANVELRVWQRISDPGRVYLSARPAGGAWGRAERLPMARTNASETFRYTDRSIDVPLPPPLPSVTVEFYGEFTDDQRVLYTEAIVEELTDVARFYRERHGIVSQDLTVRLVVRDEPEDKGFAYAQGVIYLRQNRDLPFTPRVEATEGGTVALSVPEFTFLDPIAHEYVHALQDELGDSGGPLWISEGMAWYLDAIHEQNREWSPGGVLREHDWHARHFFKSREYLWWQARKSTVPLRDMESGQWHWGVGYLATEQLVARAGEDALFDFYRPRPAGSSWQETFSDTFGLTVDAFYEEFAAWRAVEVPPPSYWSGVILGPDGDPVQDVPLRWAPSVGAGVEGFQGVVVSAIRSVVGDMDSWTTAPSVRAGWAREEGGTFRMRADPGPTVLKLAIECDEGKPLEVGFVDEAGGLTRDPDEARRYVVGLEGVSGIEIRLPRTPEELCALLQKHRQTWVASLAIGWPIGFHDGYPHYAAQFESRPWNDDR